MKKVILLFAIVIMLVLFAFSASAATEEYYYRVNSDEAHITNVSTSISGNVTIPSTLGGYPVTEISFEAFKSCTNLENVTIPDSVTYIGKEAFAYCSYLENVTIPDSVTNIGMLAFYYTNLESITIPDSVRSIGYYAFDEDTIVMANKGSYALSWAKDEGRPYVILNPDNPKENIISETVNAKLSYSIDKVTRTMTVNCKGKMPEFISYDAPWKKYELYIFRIVVKKGCSNISSKAFTGLASVSDISLPDSVTSIGEEAFAHCFGLESITISDSVTSIGKNAFYKCTSLKNIKISDGVTSIGNEAFAYCSNLENVTIPNSVTTLAAGVFENCEALKSVIIGNSIPAITNEAFKNCTNLKSIIIPDSVTSIGSYAFFNCKALKSAAIPDSVTSIADHAFYNCSSLENITISDSVKAIGTYAFYNCTSLKSATIGNGIISIHNGVFKSCTSLESVTFPTSVAFINDYAFEGCKSLQNITIPYSVTSIGSSAFYNCTNLKDIIIFSSDCNFDRECGFNYTQTIYGIPGSTAQAYADEYGLVFTDVEKIHKHTNVQLKAIAATCTEAGLTEGKKCSVCGKITAAQKKTKALGHKWTAATCTKAKTCSVCKATSGKALGHTYKNVTTKATLKKNGKVENKCSVCGNVLKTTTIYFPKTIKLSDTKYTYNGKAKKPSVTVKDSKGKALKKDTDYTIKYASGRKNTGKYTVTVTFKGKYSGTKKLTFNILPSKTSKITPTCTTTSIKASWKKVTGADGYKVELLNSKGKVVKTATTTKTAYTFKKLSKVTTYKVKVTAYKTIDKKKVYSTVSTTITTSTAPAKVTLSKVTAGKKTATPAWKAVSGVSGYEVMYSTSSKFKSSKTATVKKGSSKKTTIKKLTKGKKYYFKVRAYKTVDGKNVYGAWSAVKSVKVK